MPEQKSQRGQGITLSDFERAFETSIWPCGLGGLNLKDQLDQIPVGEFSRHTNLTHTMDRGATVRPGLTAYATGGTDFHSVRRLTDPQPGTYTRVWGIDQALFIGQSGALTNIDAGYSGNPLCLLPHRPPLSGDPWMFVADSSRMRKVRADGLDLPQGLPAPAAAATVALGTRHLVTIANFDPGSDTDFSLWTPNKGYTYDDPPVQTDLPEIFGPPGIQSPDSDDTNAIHFGRIASGPRPTGDYVFFGVPITRDLSTFGGGVDATDDDYIHLWLNFSHPLLTEEFRIYIVVSASFSPTVLPGIPDGLGNNTDFYVKSFSQADFAAYFAAQADQVSDAEAARVRAVRDQSLSAQATAQGLRSENLGRLRYIRKIPTASDPLAVSAAITDPFRAITQQGPAGADQWHELGILGVPVRRSDFQRGGETANRDWSTVTGLVVMIKSAPNSGDGPIAVRLGNFYLHGGAAPDTGEPGMQPYDYRYTDYDPRTGAESNPSPTMAETAFIDTLRREVLVTPAANGDAAIRQRIYRRGGTNTDDWNFEGVNAANGGVFTDTLSDDDAGASATLATNHYQPVPTVDDTGATVLAQPVHTQFGPANGMLFALGDPYRPGHLYFCIPDQPDHWPATFNYEVCAPSEELMAGFLYGAQPYCFSRSRLYAIYPNLSAAQQVTVSPTDCKRGLVGRKAFAVGLGGIYGVANDGIFVTGGGQEQIISQDIEPIFRGQTVNGYAPIDFAFPHAIRLFFLQDKLVFQYQDTSGNRQHMVLALLYEKKFWTHYDFFQDLEFLQQDDDTASAIILAGGKSSAKAYQHTGFSDDGTAIPWTIRTGTWNLDRPREDKLLGDQIVDIDLQGTTVTLQNRLNDESVANAVQGFDAGTGRHRYILDSFGVVPQRARNISTELLGSSASARPTLYFLGLSHIPEPDQTLNRMTQWDDFGHPDESYFTGVTFDCDTGGVTRSIIIQRDFAGVIDTVATLSVNCDGRHKVKFSWDALPAHKWRIFPNDDCKAWILYKADPIALPEPPRVARWDIHFEADGDQYFTGLDLYCDTGGVEKQIEVNIDGNVLQNPYTGEAFWRINAAGRKWVHLTFLAGRGHVFHFTAIDNNAGLLYSHKWHTDPEPSEQSNWNQNFTVYGSRADKYLKAIIFECDTFGQSKQVQIEADGVVVETISVNTNGRLVQQTALTTQQLGRVWRMYPVDGNPGRLYTAQPVFDEEPFQLTRWETQEQTWDQHGFMIPIEGQITLKARSAVTLTVEIATNQLGTTISRQYTIPSTLPAGATEPVKQKRYVPFVADKGVLIKYILTSPTAFWLYREESTVLIQPWGGDPILTHPFGNSGEDRTRGMINSALASARSGGGSD